MLFEARAVEGVTTAEIERMVREVRTKVYANIGSALTALGATKAREREVALGELARLEEQLREVERIDYFPSGAADDLRGGLGRLRARLEQRSAAPSQLAERKRHELLTTAAVPGHAHGGEGQSCRYAWLIRRLLDADAKFKFVGPGSYAPKGGELRFDMPEAGFTHVGDQCSFEVLCRRFALPCRVSRIAAIGHDLDVNDGRYLHPETGGVRTMLEGSVAQHERGQERIEAGSALFNALLAANGKQASRRNR